MMVLKKRLAILSTKGGVGKTVISINLAKAIHSYDKGVVLVDANLFTPHIATYLGKPLLDFYISDIKDQTENAIHVHKSGLHVIAHDVRLNLDKIRELDAGHHGININFNKLFKTIENLYDFLIIDTPPFISKNLIDIIKNIDETIIVVNEDIGSLTEALKTIKLAEQFDVNILGIIVNKHGLINLDIDYIYNFLDYPILAIIPHHKKIINSIKQKYPFITLYPREKFSRELISLAKDIVHYKMKYNSEK